MTTWAFSSAFWLIPLVAGIAIILFLRRKKKRAGILFSDLSWAKTVGKGIRTRFVPLPLILIWGALFIMIVALARPQVANVKTKRNVEGIDIVIALDVSDSMLIEDMKPENRMESSKATIRDFIRGRTSDRLGLVIFSGEAYTRVPMTLDYDLLQKNLAEVTTSRNIKMGTAIGVALATAVARLKDSTAKSRVIVFLTDGENNSGTIDPDTAIEIAKGYQIKVYSIGMGRDGDAQIPVLVKDFSGRTHKQYRPIHSSVNDDLLGRMASETGGKYYRATTTDALRGVFKDIDRLERTKIEMNQYIRYTEQFEIYLKWALFLLSFGFLLRETVLRVWP